MGILPGQLLIKEGGLNCRREAHSDETEAKENELNKL